MRNTSLYGSHTSPVVLCLQNNVITIRITRLYGYKLSSVVLHAKHDFWIRITSLYWFQISPVDLCMQNSVLRSTMTLSIGPSLHLWFCAFKTATLASEMRVSMGLSPNLWFIALQNSDISTRIASLYGSQTSPVVLCMKTT